MKTISDINIKNQKVLIRVDFNVPIETGHVNCSKNLLEFEKQSPMSESLYEGVLDLGEYNRFMRIGIR